ncbi:unnamed protein product [Cuscuta epithymum]|uniref:Uncharacterized protein n=1 Tax=Cuscuta epithymum TaxID=186058 RepID=A0AAV0FPI3_9ASTE|nr:unnamed protein product [Cuscuta epithymum]
MSQFGQQMISYQKKETLFQSGPEDNIEEHKTRNKPDKESHRRPNRRPKRRPSRPPTVFLESQTLTLTGFGKDRRPPTLDGRRPPTVTACGRRRRSNHRPVGFDGRRPDRNGRRPPAGPPAAAGIRRDPPGSDLTVKRRQAADG